MKNIKRLGLIMFISLMFISLTSCGLFSKFSSKYKEEAGIYECIQIRINGVNSLSYYEYYNIELKANGDCIVTSKQSGGYSYEANATFEIKDEKIIIYTKSGFSTITEEYGYIEGMIIMDTSLNGSTIYAEFSRK